ncbi:hypothetical protein CASFOL_032010 [Castilleja foliolosa]|uniref:Uncharacterized protein n=1 Tax=Castilleja foliolosa TaxID=1961234 RepID=A0ABD3C174_9LAMI
MEENKRQILHGECPRKLNLNVPPLSTRRPFAVTTNNVPMGNAISNMVPFSWERIPGEPKDKYANDDINLPPTPKLPPGWRTPPYDIISGGSSNGVGHKERFSNAIDIFSLAESTDDIEADYDEATKDRSSEMMPNFIIERFLPDAQALAEASVMNKEFPLLSSPDCNVSFSRGVGVRRSCHLPKGCGLGSLLPWRMKPKPCSVKSPVCDTIIGANQKKNR